MRHAGAAARRRGCGCEGQPVQHGPAALPPSHPATQARARARHLRGAQGNTWSEDVRACFSSCEWLHCMFREQLTADLLLSLVLTPAEPGLGPGPQPALLSLRGGRTEARVASSQPDWRN